MRVMAIAIHTLLIFMHASLQSTVYAQSFVLSINDDFDGHKSDRHVVCCARRSFTRTRMAIC